MNSISKMPKRNINHKDQSIVEYEEKINQMKRKREINERRNKKMALIAQRMLVTRYLFVFILVAIAAAGIIGKYVKYTELKAYTTTLRNQGSKLDDQIMHKNLEIEKNISIKQIENYAVYTLDMVKIDVRQINNINLNETDKIEIIENPAKNRFSDVISAVNRSFNKFLEYIK